MGEVWNIIEYIKKAQYELNYEELENKVYKKFRHLFLKEKELINVEFKENNIIDIVYYDPKEEIEIQTNMKVVCM